MKSKIINAFVIIALLSTTITGCKSRALKRANSNLSLVEQYWNNQQQFDYLTLRGKATITNNGSDQTVSVNIRMKQDSIIWITAGMMGFEGARALITQDSFSFMNKLNNTYSTYSIGALESFIGFKPTIRQVQNILLSNATFEKDAYQEFDSSTYLRSRMGSITNTVEINELGRTKKSKYTSSDMRQRSDIQYDDYVEMDDFILPKLINTEVQRAGKFFKVVINYQSVSSSPISNFPFRIPDGYKKN